MLAAEAVARNRRAASAAAIASLAMLADFVFVSRNAKVFVPTANESRFRLGRLEYSLGALDPGKSLGLVRKAQDD